MCSPVELFESVLLEVHDHSKWDGATFARIKTISNTKVGSVGQLFIERLCDQLSMPCSFPTNPSGKRLTQNPWDIKIANIEFELKTATEDTSGNFQFNHIRYHRPYQGLLCLGVSPANLYIGVWSKADVATGKAGNLVSMEKGANASYKLTKSKNHLTLLTDFQSIITKFSADFINRN
ncbi:MAG: hypothetical protein P4L35_01900 [Ignavibacteriaceae bacterium]|nr:hypothetical protein [Ignavibacteriaceae bacterium]